MNIAHLGVPPEALAGCVLDVTEAAVARADTLFDAIRAHHDYVVSAASRGRPASLDGEDLRVVRRSFAARALTGLAARRATAIGVDFSNAQLQGARFDGADMRECDFSGADLRGASFRGCRLAHARFDGARIGALDLADGRPMPPDFTGAQAVPHQFAYAILDGDIAALGIGAAATQAA